MDKLIRPCACLIALSLAIACSRSPNEPDVTAASFAGRWGGYYRLVSWDPPHSAYQAGTQKHIIVDIDRSGLTAKVITDYFLGAGVSFAGALQSDGSLVLTPVTLTGRSDEVTRIVIRRLAPGRLTGELTYLSDFPTRTFNTVIDQMTRVAEPPAATTASALVGAWGGFAGTNEATYTLCAGPPAMCTSRFSFPRPAGVTLRIARVSNGYEADIQIRHEHGDHRFRTTGTESGGGIAFRPVTMPTDPAGFTQLLSVFDVRLDPSGRLTGLVEYTTTGPPGSATRRIEIRNATRGDTVRPPGGFQGTWIGRYFVRTCTGECITAPTSGFASFTLSQRGTELVGASSLANRVTGTATGDSATFEGDDASFAVTIDSMGLMRGTFTRHGRDGDRQYTIQGELWDVVRMPSLLW